MLFLGLLKSFHILFVLFLLLLIVCVSCFVVVIDLLVVLAHNFVVLVDLLVVLAHSLIVIANAHAVGIGGLGRLGQIQLGICQLTAGNGLVIFCSGIIALLSLLVLLCNFLILRSNFLILFFHCVVVFCGFHLVDAQNIGLCLIHRGNVGGQEFDLVQLRCLNLGGEGNGHCQCHCDGAAGLGQELLVILLSHNFNLLKYHIERLKYWRPGCHGFRFRPLSFASRPFGRFAVGRYFLFTITVYSLKISVCVTFVKFQKIKKLF